MILLVETDKTISKRLCDMLNRERVITVDSQQAALEAIVRHKRRLDVIVADLRLFLDFILSDIIKRVCERLSMNVPPIVIIYREKDQKALPGIGKLAYQCSFIKYDLKDMNFPEKYVKVIRSMYPEVIANMIVANEVWLNSAGKQEIIDVSKWFTDQGFIETASKAAPVINNEVEKEDNEDDIAYKKKYLELQEKYNELKKKYEELIKQMKNLAGSG